MTYAQYKASYIRDDRHSTSQLASVGLTPTPGPQLYSMANQILGIKAYNNYACLSV